MCIVASFGKSSANTKQSYFFEQSVVHSEILGKVGGFGVGFEGLLDIVLKIFQDPPHIPPRCPKSALVFSDSDRVGRGEWSRVYDACMVVRVYLSGLRAPCMPRRCLRRLETRHPYHLGGVFWYGSSISIIIYLSLIRGISSVADGEKEHCGILPSWCSPWH